MIMNSRETKDKKYTEHQDGIDHINVMNCLCRCPVVDVRAALYDIPQNKLQLESDT